MLPQIKRGQTTERLRYELLPEPVNIVTRTWRRSVFGSSKPLASALHAGVKKASEARTYSISDGLIQSPCATGSSSTSTSTTSSTSTLTSRHAEPSFVISPYADTQAKVVVRKEALSQRNGPRDMFADMAAGSPCVPTFQTKAYNHHAWEHAEQHNDEYSHPHLGDVRGQRSAGPNERLRHSGFVAQRWESYSSGVS